ncbi:MAG: type secretion system family protein [Glaciihabitans sp.]|nr:type secretion system family protein [Glaciihabitans sp.]
MPTKTFSYHGMNLDGKTIKGKVDADSRETVVSRLADQGIVPMTVAEAGTGFNRDIKIPGLTRTKPTLKDLVVFSRQFATMVSSGLSLVRSLSILGAQAERPGLKAAIGALDDEVRAGSALSAAMQRRGDIFPPLMYHMVRAGETGGFLDKALDRVATVLEAESKLRSKIKGAMVYPLVVLCLMFVLVTVMLIFIVPVFQGLFDQLGGQLPVPTQVLVVLSDNIWWVIPTLVILIIVGRVVWRRAVKNLEFLIRVDTIKLKLPVFGQLNRKVAMSRFARNLGMLLGAGVPILQALDVVAETTGNAKVSQVIGKVQEAVREGKSLSGPMSDNPEIFPAMVSQMLQVGEDTGQVETMLSKVAEFYDLEVETTTDALASLLEPLLIVVLGVVVGAMVVSLYLPMFSIYDQIK